jgi:glucokinase
MDHVWIGVDLGGTKTLAGLFDHNLQLLARAKLPTPAADGPAAVLGVVVKAVDTVLEQTGTDRGRVRGLGIGLPGQVESQRQFVRFAPNLDWHNLDLTAHLPNAWTWPVVPENDVKLGTYGEWTHGAARGARHVLGIFPGTGVGGGLILDGKLYSGFNFSAGEIGHTVLHWRKGTTLEGIAGRRNIGRRAADILSDAPKKVRKDWKNIDPTALKSSHLAELYQKNDPVAVQVIDDAARALGAAVGSAINLLSPEVVVVGGGVAGALGDAFLERIWEFARRYTLPNVTDGMRFVAATLGDDAGIVGAAAYARDRVSAAPPAPAAALA